MQLPDPSSAPLADLLERLPMAPELGSRTLFPTLATTVYANHAAISPASMAVEQAVSQFVSDSARLGLGTVLPWMAQRERLRGKLARLLGAADADIALTAGTSAGILNIAMGHPWRAGDGVVLFRGEFPANVTPWLQAARLFGLTPRWVDLQGFADGSGDGLAQTEAALKAGASLVAVSAVQFQTGLRMPLEALSRLCRAYGAALFVDAIQACGAVPLGVDGIDYLACGTHKWLMGLEGAGVLYIDPARVGALQPRLTSWLSHEDGLGFLFHGAGHLQYDRPIRRRADMFEASAPQVALFAALEAGLSLTMSLGIDRVFEHIQAWHDRLEPLLCAQGFVSLRAANAAGRSGSLCVLPPEDVGVVDLNSLLAAEGVSVAIPDGCLRFSPHWPNALAEAEQVADVVAGAVDAIRRGKGTGAAGPSASVRS